MLELKKMPNGFEYIEVRNDAASAKIALQGAHIFSYKPHDKEELLWLSEVSSFEPLKAIRGGIPLCWPWFGMNEDKTLPQHGFSRTSMFELLESKEVDSRTTTLRLQLTQTPQSLKLWKYDFVLELKLTISDTLTLELTTTNTDTKTFSITQALHTYLSISDIEDIVIEGLEQKPYYDALTQEQYIQKGSVVFNAELDRVYQKVDASLTLIDSSRIINVKNEGSSSVVVWNPWIEKCARMSAMKNNAYKDFVCIESANAMDDYRVLQPKKSHTLKATLSF